MVNQLAQDYAGQPVVFLEYDVDNSALFRSGRWWSAHGGGSVTLPLVMVDSGHQFSNGYEDFNAKYRSMVDASMAREAQADIIATGQRVGDTLQFNVEVNNKSSVTLSYSNNAAVWVIVYETFGSSGAGRLTNRFVRATARTSFSSPLPPNGVENFVVDTPTLNGVVWDNLRAVVLVDYLPNGSSGAYDMLQAVSVTSFP
ncbi:MAG: hypothetical protein GWP17_04615 [Aquificales bacterium]|nr:hypothetical protein [Aquificales bacterium]